MDKLTAVAVLVLVTAGLIICAEYYSFDSLRFKANARFKRIRPSLVIWADSVVRLCGGLDEYGLNIKNTNSFSAAEVNRLCAAANERLAQLARNGENVEALTDRLSELCAEVFGEVSDYNDAVLAYNKKAITPLGKLVAQLLHLRAPEQLSDFFFQ